MASDYAGSAEVTLPGTNQILKQGTKTATPWTSRSNKVQAGSLPRTSGPSVGSPTRANPLGANSATSLNG